MGALAQERHLLEKTILMLKGNIKIGVIEGDIAGTDDAERISSTACRLSRSTRAGPAISMPT